MMRWPLLLLVVLAATLVARPADAQRRLANVEPGAADAALLAIAVPIDLGLLFVHPPPAVRSTEPFGLDAAAGRALAWRRPRAAAVTSDWLLRSFIVAHVAGPAVGTAQLDRATGAGTTVGVEALAMTELVTGLIKHAVRRERPGGAGVHGDEAWASFFSGHTSVAFSGATMLTVYAHEYGWSDTAQWAVPATAFTLAAFTGYLRVAGERHWLTDVLAGALVGTGTAYLTYHIRAAGR